MLFQDLAVILLLPYLIKELPKLLNFIIGSFSIISIKIVYTFI